MVSPSAGAVPLSKRLRLFPLPRLPESGAGPPGKGAYPYYLPPLRFFFPQKNLTEARHEQNAEHQYRVGKHRMAMMELAGPVIVPNREREPATPSMVAFAKTGECMAGEDASRQALFNPRRTVSNVWQELGSSRQTDVDGSLYSPAEVAAILLQRLREDAQACWERTIFRQYSLFPPAFPRNSGGRWKRRDAWPDWNRRGFWTSRPPSWPGPALGTEPGTFSCATWRKPF